MFPYQHTTQAQSFLFMTIKCCILKESSGWILIWIMRQMSRKSKTQISGLKIDSLFCSLTLISQCTKFFLWPSKEGLCHQSRSICLWKSSSTPSPLPQPNTSNKMRASCCQIVAGSSMSITGFNVYAVFYCNKFWNIIEMQVHMEVDLIRIPVYEASRLLQAQFVFFL